MLFRDRINECIGDANMVKLTRRQIIDLYYSGLIDAAKHCGQAKDADQLNTFVSELFQETEDFVYGKYRRQAAELVKKFGEVEARQRLRAIALDKGWFVDQATQYFGVDLTKFDDVSEMVNLTRALRNRGIDFHVEIHNAGESPDGPGRVKVDVDSARPLDASKLAEEFGGADIHDCRAETIGQLSAAQPPTSGTAEPIDSEVLPTIVGQQTPDYERPNRQDDCGGQRARDHEVRFATADGRSHTRAQRARAVAELIRCLGG